MTDNFEKSWKQYYKTAGDKRNKKVAIIALLAGTVLIVPDVLFTPDYSRMILSLRVVASLIGFIGYFLFLFKFINNRVMVLLYALPVFILSSYMVAIETDHTIITQLNNTLAVVGIFFMATFILNVTSWIIICASLYVSYILSVLIVGELQFSQYLLHGGSLVLIGFLTFPFISRIRYKLNRENYKLNFEVNQQKEKLEFYANNDLLTHAFNRRGGMKILEQAISISNRHHLPLSICFVDIDGLKKVNDEFGHAAGDILIQTISGLITGNIRESDILFRLGGDEFIIVFPGCTIEDSNHIMELIRNKTSEYKSDDTKKFNVSFSYGLSEYDGVKTIDEFIISADKAMYSDKR